MTPAAILYLFGMLLVLTGERVVGGADPISYGVSGLGLALLAASYAYNFRQHANATEPEKYDPSLPLALKIGRFFEHCVEKIFLDADGK